MKKILKWTLLVAGTLMVIGFFAFLYLIPPFTLAPPEAFIEPERQAPPAVESISDRAERAIAERGRYIILTVGCSGCHTTGGDKGPKFDTEYLAGGRKFAVPKYGTVVSRNLTPDPKTGLARRTTASGRSARGLDMGKKANDVYGLRFSVNSYPPATIARLQTAFSRTVNRRPRTSFFRVRTVATTAGGAPRPARGAGSTTRCSTSTTSAPRRPR